MPDTDQVGELGVNLTGRRVLEAGHIFRRQEVSDFGIDAQIEIKEVGLATGRLIAVQIKSGASYFANEVDAGFWHYVSDRHRELWINHSLPVIVVLCKVDTNECFYEIVTDETCIRAGNRWKLLVPKDKILTSESASDLIALASPIVAASDYSIHAEHDESHANARRVSLDVVVHPGSRAINKPLLGAIARAALAHGQSSKYHRDELTEMIIGDRPVDVVWGFVYLRDVDRDSASWACKFQWISPSLDKRFCPLPFEGEKDGGGLVITWNNNTDLPKLLDERRATKADYLKRVDELLALLPPIREKLAVLVEKGDKTVVSEEFQSLASDYEGVWDDASTAPKECQRLDQAVQELIANVGNAGLIWGQRQSRDHRATLSFMKSYHKELDRLSVEIDFLRRDIR